MNAPPTGGDHPHPNPLPSRERGQTVTYDSRSRVLRLSKDRVTALRAFVGPIVIRPYDVVDNLSRHPLLRVAGSLPRHAASRGSRSLYSARQGRGGNIRGSGVYIVILE